MPADRSASTKDKYPRFAHLAAAERESIDYKIEIARRDSPIAIVAPHGGYIEPNTTEIGRDIADGDFNFYSFMGLIPNRPHRDLHITSHRFDEPTCLDLISRCDVIVTVHGRRDGDDPHKVCLGGRDTNLIAKIGSRLVESGFPTRTSGHEFSGENPMNICNRGHRRMGAQLELPRSLRDELAGHPERRSVFTTAIRRAIID